MEIYDIVMIVVLVGAAVFGAVKGFAWQLASIASILVSYIVAYRFREPFSQSIHADPPWNRFLAMLILYIGTALVIWVAFRMISGSIDRMRLREFDRQIGFLFGLAKGGLYCTLITLFAVTLLGDTIRGKVVASKSGRYISQILDKSESVIPSEIHEVVQPYLQRLDDRFAGTGSGRETALGDSQPWLKNIPERAGETLPAPIWNRSANQAAQRQPPTVNPQPWPPAGNQYQRVQQAQANPPWNGFQR